MGAGFSVNAKDENGNPLLFVAMQGVGSLFSSDAMASERIVQILIDAGADVNARSADGDTLIYSAVRWAGGTVFSRVAEAYNRVVKILLDAGAAN